MTGWVEVATVAFVTQLAVLPGEKVQFIVAGLSTRYDPKVVVAAAGSAFAGWTALEITVGAALQRAVSPLVLDAITAGLFALFAVLLVRAAPDGGGGDSQRASMTDGGVSVPSAPVDGGDVLPSAPVDGGDVTDRLDVDLSERFGGFVPIFAMMAAGEFGDKTQLVTIGLAAQYGAHPGIWAGEMLAVIPVTTANAFFFHRFAGRVDARKAHLAGAALFAFFALDTVLAITTGFSVWEGVVSTVVGAVTALV